MLGFFVFLFVVIVIVPCLVWACMSLGKLLADMEMSREYGMSLKEFRVYWAEEVEGPYRQRKRREAEAWRKSKQLNQFEQ